MNGRIESSIKELGRYMNVKKNCDVYSKISESNRPRYEGRFFRSLYPV